MAAQKRSGPFPGISKHNLFLAAALILAFPSGFLLRSDGGINLDALMYAQKALLLPEIRDNLFPPAYPILLRFFAGFSADFFLAGKLLNAFCLLLMLGFSWRKQFFFRETLVLLCTKAGIGLWPFSFSEIPFLTALYFQFYLLYQFWQGKTNRMQVLAMAGIQVLFILLRHAGIFLFPGLLLFSLMLWQKKEKTEIPGSWAGFIGWSSVFLVAALGWNYIQFHSFFGEHLRGAPEALSAAEWKEHILLNLRGLFAMANPFFSLVFQYGDGGIISRIALFGDGLLLGLFLWLIYRTAKEKSPFQRLLLLNGSVYLSLLFVSSFQAGIEILNTRLMAPGLWCLYFPVIIYLNKNLKPSLLSVFAWLSLCLNLGYLLKTPAWYPGIRQDAKQILLEKPRAFYFFLDQDSIPARKYRLPFTDRELEYRHPVLASGYINRHALMILRPEMELLDSARMESIAARRKGIPPDSILLNSRCRIRAGF